ncbi:MAG: hypothetical protein LBT89_11275 [Planctomycetaceae bacterium]|nr:hypothetical protein [Planctomycetaceae bacterium]
MLKTPRKLLRELSKCFDITNPTNGIYYVNGDTSPTQIVVSADLAEEDNLWLRSLREDLDVAGMDRVITQQERSDGKLSAEAYLQVILKANPFIFQEIQDMGGKTFDEVMEEAGATTKWVNRGIALGRNAVSSAARLITSYLSCVHGFSPFPIRFKTVSNHILGRVDSNLDRFFAKIIIRYELDRNRIR